MISDPALAPRRLGVASQGFTESCATVDEGLMCHVHGFGLGCRRLHCSNDHGAAVAVVAGESCGST
jgi:hypothetical protein